MSSAHLRSEILFLKMYTLSSRLFSLTPVSYAMQLIKKGLVGAWEETHSEEKNKSGYRGNSRTQCPVPGTPERDAYGAFARLHRN